MTDLAVYERGYHRRGPCECCGESAATVSYGEADQSGHLWYHQVCETCSKRCMSDENGNPVHRGCHAEE